MQVQSSRRDWWEVAACASYPVDLFVYPDRPTGAVERRAVEAQSVCYTCSVRTECAQAEADAIQAGALPYKYQVRGGLRLWADELPPPTPDPIPNRHGPDRCATCLRNGAAWCPHPERPSHRPATNPYTTTAATKAAIPLTRRV